MHRRNFLRNIAVTAAFGPFASGCSGIRRTDVRLNFNDAVGLDRKEFEILRLASLAPNGHNTQPWSVRLRDHRHWIVESDGSRWLPAVDPEQRETILSIGAFLENLSIAAAQYGLHADFDVVARSRQDKELVSVTLTEGKNSAGSLISSIESRRTIRSNFLSTCIAPDDLRYVTGQDGDRFHYYPASSPHGQYLSEGTVLANRVQCNRLAAQKELSDWIRWSDSEARRKCDGLTPETMEISGVAGWYVRTFYDREDVLTQAFIDRSMKKVTEQATVHGGWVVLTSKDSTVTSLVDSGRVLQRMLLRVKDRMIAVHPMTQMLEERPWKDLVARELAISDEIQFILRVGYVSSYPEPVSLRRSPERFVRSEEGR